MLTFDEYNMYINSYVLKLCPDDIAASRYKIHYIILLLYLSAIYDVNESTKHVSFCFMYILFFLLQKTAPKV